MKNFNEKSYIIIPNVSFGFGTEYHLTPDELLVYTHLQMLKGYGYKHQIITSVALLAEILDWSKAKASRGKDRVVTALVGLESKGYIENEINKGTLKTAPMIVVTIFKEVEEAELKTEVEWRDSDFTWKGFTKITSTEFEQVETDGQQLMILAYALWRENAKFEYKISYKEWSLVLGVSEKTVRNIMSDFDVVEKKSGKIIVSEDGKVTQEPNSYKVNDKKPDMEEVKSEGEKKAKKGFNIEEKFQEFVIGITDDNYFGEIDILRQVFMKDVFLTVDSYKAIKETTCETLKEAGEAKLSRLPEGVIKGLERAYQNQSTEAKPRESVVIPHEFKPFESSYKKAKKENYSFIED